MIKLRLRTNYFEEIEPTKVMPISIYVFRACFQKTNGKKRCIKDLKNNGIF